MENKTDLKKITRLIILSWFAAALFAFLFISARVENAKLKNFVAVYQRQLASLKSTTNEYERLKSESAKWRRDSADYLNWQFVLKDQVALSGVKLLNAIGKIPNLKKDKELAGILYYNLGLGYVMVMDFDSAIKAFQMAVSIKNDADSFYNLGLLYTTYKNNPRQAIKYYEKFLMLAPDSHKVEEVKDRIAALKK